VQANNTSIYGYKGTSYYNGGGTIATGAPGDTFGVKIIQVRS
jgi:hypothetical protein